MKKKCKIVRLTSDNESKLRLDNNGVLSFEPNIKGLYYNGLEHTYQHLYLVSNEEIKYNDWYIDDTNQIRQSITDDKEYWDVRQDYLKIIATTDKSLSITESNVSFTDRDIQVVLPWIPESFIKAYVESNGEIDEVMVEYSSIPADRAPNGWDTYVETTEDNEVIISLPKKKIYTRDEVIKLIKKFNNRLSDQVWLNFDDDWIKENL